MSNHDRQSALVRDIGRRLAISSIEEVEQVDAFLLELERVRHGMPSKPAVSKAVADFIASCVAPPRTEEPG
jgi:hypothetical protein